MEPIRMNTTELRRLQEAYLQELAHFRQDLTQIGQLSCQEMQTEPLLGQYLAGLKKNAELLESLWAQAGACIKTYEACEQSIQDLLDGIQVG